jgi:hypothetical protein
MTTEPTSQTPGRRLGGGQIAAFITAGVIAVISVGLIGLGAIALWGDSEKDAHGYVSTGYEQYTSSTRAITTQNLDADLDGLGEIADQGALGSIRLKAAPTMDAPVFVGIARTDDVTRYLKGTSHAVLTDVDYSPFRAEYARQGGAGRPAAPAKQSFWAASAHGSTTQTLTWDIQDGDWSVVVMNADGSAGVNAGISAGVELPWLGGLGWGLVGGGTLLLLVAGAITLVAAAPARRRTTAPAPAAA